MKIEMNKEIIKHLIEEINFMAKEEINIMEVCGTHTQMISRLGIRSVLSPKIKLLSGPGCPVCVTDETYIDRAIEMLNKYDVTIATFGDLMRVKGTKYSLLDEKSKGKDIRIIHSPLDLIYMAQENKDKKFIFLAVGFETTAPVIALSIKTALERGLDNLYFYTSLKLMKPILHHILKNSKNRVQGLICPGHVASITGGNYFKFIAEEYNIPAAVCGFEALDILGGIHYLVENITENKKNSFINLYKKCVRPQGNPKGNKLLKEVFKVSHGNWRGIGTVGNSFLTIDEKYQKLDAEKVFKVKTKPSKAKENCQCSDILMGNKSPEECRLFAWACNPDNPQGPCMVSSEGACRSIYKYGRWN